MDLVLLYLTSRLSAWAYWKDTNQQPFFKPTKSKSVQYTPDDIVMLKQYKKYQK